MVVIITTENVHHIYARHHTASTCGELYSITVLLCLVLCCPNKWRLNSTNCMDNKSYTLILQRNGNGTILCEMYVSHQACHFMVIVLWVLQFSEYCCYYHCWYLLRMERFQFEHFIVIAINANYAKNWL